MAAPLLLIVEDNQALRDTLRDLCEEAGYQVRTAGDGQAALDWLVSGPTPALILLDLVMPALNGWELARRIRPLARFRTVPIIVVSGVADPADPRLAALQPAAVFSKPFEAPLLLAVIRDQVQPGERS